MWRLKTACGNGGLLGSNSSASRTFTHRREGTGHRGVQLVEMLDSLVQHGPLALQLRKKENKWSRVKYSRRYIGPKEMNNALC